MRALVQRVSEARVRVDGEIIGEIEHGVLALIGITHDDTPEQAARLAEKIANLRIFTDDDDKMNLSVLDVGGSVLAISQFTLYGDTRKGRRPSYINAARPEVAEPLCDAVVEALRALDVPVETGRFRTDMKVELINDGPVTLSIEV
ncbi:MAG: D-tyrosyl-tRNA(Tyr) deacylase [Acidimicrobiales bacterium]|jgi:D-tyrosyl-tRNA(Tyr) deacylase